MLYISHCIFVVKKYYNYINNLLNSTKTESLHLSAMFSVHFSHQRVAMATETVYPWWGKMHCRLCTAVYV